MVVELIGRVTICVLP